LEKEEAAEGDPAAGVVILNADDRPNRDNAAAAGSNGNGRGVDHGRGYKAAPARRQDVPSSFRDGPKDQTRNLEIPQCAIAHWGSMLSHRPGMTMP
jgi:hypothetical protein